MFPTVRVTDIYPWSSDDTLRHLNAAICTVTVDVIQTVSVKVSNIEGATYTEGLLFTVTLEEHVLSWKRKNIGLQFLASGLSFPEKHALFIRFSCAFHFSGAFHFSPPKIKTYLVGLPSALYQRTGQNERFCVESAVFVAFQVVFI